MTELIPNGLFQKDSTPSFVRMLNKLGVKANVTEKGFEYDYEAFKSYASKTPKYSMPIWLTQMNEVNLKWLLSGE